MAKYFRPRRGKKATAESQNIVLKRGEMFMEVPASGVGTGIGKIKIGDGTTAYKDLPYFLEQGVDDVSTAVITYSDSTQTNNNTLLSTIKSGAKFNVIIPAIKKLLSNINTSVNDIRENGGRITTKAASDSLKGIQHNADILGGIYTAADIAGIYSSLNDQPQFVYDETGKITGYKTKTGGADTVFPFKSGGEIINLGRVSNGTRTFDLTGYDGYENFTVDNFIIAIASLSASISFNVNTRGGAASTSTSASYTKSYNATTGTLTINGGGSSAGVSSYSGKYNSGGGSVNLTSSVTVYLVK